MNVKQRIVLFMGALVFVALSAYPPWHDKGSKASIAPYNYSRDVPEPVVAEEYDSSLGYMLIFRPPAFGAMIDLSRLGVEWLTIIVFTGSLIVVLSKRQNDAE
jgi:hypothetical protein